MKKILRTFLLFILTIISQSAFSQGEQIFQDSVVHEIRLNFANFNFWSDLTSNYDSFYPDIPYILADATIDGNPVDSIGVRLKGFSSYFFTSTNKKSIKLDFNEFVPGKKYDGLRKVNLNNGQADPAIQRDLLSYNMMREIGVAAPRTAYAKVFLNDQYWGLYLLVEQIDKTFLKENFGNSKGNLFKNIGFSTLEWMDNNPESYQESIQLKSDPQPGAWERFVNLIDVINNSSDADFKNQISEIFDVDQYLRVLAVDVATSNWDSYLEHGRNFYIYEDSVSQKFTWIPWDYNLSMGGHFAQSIYEDPENCETILNGSCPYPPTDSIFLLVIAENSFCCFGVWDNFCQNSYNNFSNDTVILDPFYTTFPVDISGSNKVLIRRLLEVPAFEERYYQHWCGLMEDNFTEERLFPLIEFYGDLIREDIANDPNYLWSLQNFNDDLDQGNGYIIGLKSYVTKQVMRFRDELDQVFECSEQVSFLNRNDIVINEFSASSDSLSGLPDPAGEYEDWIEIFNNTDTEIDLSNAYLTDKIDNIKKWNFPLGTTLPANDYLIIWADEDGAQSGLHANFKLSRSGEFIQLTDYDMVLDSVTYSEQVVNLPAARVPNGTGNFVIQSATFGFNNEEIMTATRSVLATDFQVFPNPAGDYFSVKLPSSPMPGTRLTLYNGIGQPMLSQQLSQVETLVNIADLAHGSYYLRIDGLGVMQLQIF